MKPHAAPFFAVEGGDVSVFASQEVAAAWLEAIDVEEGAYQFFTADGAKLRLTTEGNRVIVTDEEVGKDPLQLAEALRHYLLLTNKARRGELDRAAIERASLDELVAMFWTVEGPPRLEFQNDWIAQLVKWIWARIRGRSSTTGSSN